MSVVKIGDKIKITKSQNVIFPLYDGHQEDHHRHYKDSYEDHLEDYPDHRRVDLGIKGTFCGSLRGSGLLSTQHRHHQQESQKRY